MISQLIKPEILELINSRNFQDLKSVMLDWEPMDIAEIILDMDENEQLLLFRLLPTGLAADVFEYFDYDTQVSLIHAMGGDKASEILNEMSPDDRTALFEEMPSNVVKQMLAYLSPDERKIARDLLLYPENSIGRLMTPDYIAIKKEWTVSQTLEHIRKYGQDKETLNVIYVIDDKGHLIDDIKIREFLLAELETPVIDLMDGNYVLLKVHDDQESAIEVFKKYDRIALPVTDNSGVLLGIVTVDDVLDIAEAEATEDIQKIAAVEALEESYPETGYLSMIKKRAGWLSVLFVGEMFTASAMTYFENEISKAVFLAVFVPLIISSGGNSGSQASTLIIRALALGEISIKNWFSVFRKELLVGLTLGVILALLGFFRVYIWQSTTDSFASTWVMIGLTVSFSLVGVVMWGTLMGSMLPLLLKRIGFDPATSSAPFIATLVDVTGILIYFSLAVLFLHGTLL
ncbi:MAG: magnesium transporter [Ignavibacteriales bacterium CG_4_9_14_3_um_filter_34_10]|nr:MAG: magnesium transporter [Ignavibacteriales bacterium CG_4_9_14_3_um_filter_34_10]